MTEEPEVPVCREPHFDAAGWCDCGQVGCCVTEKDGDCVCEECACAGVFPRVENPYRAPTMVYTGVNPHPAPRPTPTPTADCDRTEQNRNPVVTPPLLLTR